MKTATEYYAELMEANADSYGEVVKNSKGQFIKFYEHPVGGDCSPVIAVCHESKQAADTNFFDTGDMYEGSDYLPVFVDGELKCEFELV
jgi:hypothetical protein